MYGDDFWCQMTNPRGASTAGRSRPLGGRNDFATGIMGSPVRRGMCLLSLIESLRAVVTLLSPPAAVDDRSRLSIFVGEHANVVVVCSLSFFLFLFVLFCFF